MNKMHTFFIALFLLPVPVSISALAHSGTDQEVPEVRSVIGGRHNRPAGPSLRWAEG
jgi:hypothetical protein